MKNIKKTLSICMIAMTLLSVMNMGVFAAETENPIVVENINGEGVGVSCTAPMLMQDNIIQPYGSSPPAYGNYYSLNNGAYSGSITWMASYMYSNKWIGKSAYTITLNTNFRAYYTQQNAIDKTNPLTVATATKFRLVGSDGSSTSWQSIENDADGGSVTFGVTPNMTYYLEISPVSGYYTSGSFTLE